VAVIPRSEARRDPVLDESGIPRCARDDAEGRAVSTRAGILAEPALIEGDALGMTTGGDDAVADSYSGKLSGCSRARR
jgi:hypothetical protein